MPRGLAIGKMGLTATPSPCLTGSLTFIWKSDLLAGFTCSDAKYELLQGKSISIHWKDPLQDAKLTSLVLADALGTSCAQVELSHVSLLCIETSGY